jgi:hypothetical protein
MADSVIEKQLLLIKGTSTFQGNVKRMHGLTKL